MSELGRVLETMLRAGPGRKQLTIAVASHHDARYLAELVDPALGTSVTPLARPRMRIPWHRETELADELRRRGDTLVRLDIQDDRRWRYSEFDAVGSELASQGSDGQRRWYRDRGGKIRVWQPAEPERIDELPDTAWQPNVSAAVREMLDPLLTLPALAVANVEPAVTQHGPVVRITGAPRSSDLVESAIVSPWAHLCDLDVQLATGIVVRATNVRDTDWLLVTHEVTELDLDAAHNATQFKP